MNSTHYSKKTSASRICFTSGTISLVKIPFELEIIMPPCLNPHLYPPRGFPLLYMSSYPSRPWLLHADTLICFQRTLLSEIQLKCTKTSAFQKESINSHIWSLLEKRGSDTLTESRSGYLQRQLTAVSTLTGLIHALCGRRLLFLQDAQNREQHHLSTFNTCSGWRCFKTRAVHTSPIQH